MKNYYYFSFYLLIITLKKVNKKHPDVVFAAITCLSVLLWFNFYTIIGLFQINGFRFINRKVFYIGSMIILLGINYHLLNKKSGRIISFFDSRDRNILAYKLSSFAFLLYIVITLSLAFYIISLVRQLPT
jgi:hypothetical protein